MRFFIAHLSILRIKPGHRTQRLNIFAFICFKQGKGNSSCLEVYVYYLLIPVHKASEIKRLNTCVSWTTNWALSQGSKCYSHRMIGSGMSL
jgi:hypothetical protein